MHNFTSNEVHLSCLFHFSYIDKSICIIYKFIYIYNFFLLQFRKTLLYGSQMSNANKGFYAEIFTYI